MTRIESIQLQGFKSFGERTRLEFGPGIIAIVGPNGSGKSNVVEGLKWVTQAARTRELRASSATDLIFHGGDGKASTGLAEVQLELKLSSSSGGLSVARRVYRDGQSEQDLAGKRVRVRDVHEVLRGTGLGLGALALIGQGEVSGVVSADGSTLLGYLEAAAGLSRLAGHRQDTLSKLGEAAVLRERLELLLGERGRSLEGLGQEAARWQQSSEISEKIARLEAALRYAKVRSLHLEIAEMQGREHKMALESAELLVQLEGIGRDLEQGRAELAQLQLSRAEQVQAKAKVDSSKRAIQDGEKLLEVLHQDRLRRQAELSELGDIEIGEKPDLEELEVTLGQVRLQLKNLHLELGKLEKRYAQKQKEHSELERKRTALQTLLGEENRLKAQLEEAAGLLKQSLNNISEFQNTSQLVSPEALERQRTDLQTKIQQEKLERSRLEQNLTGLEREKTRLERTLSGYSRYGEGARIALTSSLEGILGSVADLIRVPAEFETAIVAALGRRLENVVVQNAPHAQAAIRHLKKVGGRATFLPLELLNSRLKRQGDFMREAGVIGWGDVWCPSSLPLLAENLLGDTLLVEDDAVAVKIARKYSRRPRLVTLTGEVLEPSGALSGGQLRDSASTSQLSDLRRLGELEGEQLELNSQREKLEKSKTAKQLAELENQLEECKKHWQAFREQERTLERESERQRDRHEQLSKQLLQLQNRTPLQAPLEGEALGPLEVQISEFKQALEAWAAREREEQAALEEGRREVLSWQHAQQALVRRDGLQKVLVELEGKGAAQVMRLQSLEQQLAAELLELARWGVPETSPLEAQLAGRGKDQARVTALLSTRRSELENLRIALARRESSLLEFGEVLPVEEIEGTPRLWNAQLSELQTQLLELGAVNPLAPQQFALENAAFVVLHTELEDARLADLELRNALSDLERDLQSALRQAFERVSLEFARYSHELLGGSGELQVLLDQGHLVGLALNVQPAGKRTKALNLLSTGERTLVALAFLFALSSAPLEAEGLPIAVLDEVDAPLDEANIRRFTHFLKLQAAKGTQFILVTHQKATMEVADALWGVTSRGGVSKVFSIRSSEVLGG